MVETAAVGLAAGLTAIAAVAANGVIGDGQRMPWQLPDDLRRFRRLTWGGVLIQGRRTFEALGVPLAGRLSIVVTRDREWQHPGVVVASDVAAALRLLDAYPERRWWCIGGGQTYRQFWPYTTQLDLTEVRLTPLGSVTFPEVTLAEWQEISREAQVDFDCVTYTRRDPAVAERLALAVTGGAALGDVDQVVSTAHSDTTT